MLKKLVLVLAVILPMSAFAQKFGVVDLEAVISVMPETKAANDQITEASKKYEAEFQKLQETVQKLYTEFQTIQNDPATPETIKERRMQEIQDGATKLEQFRQTAYEDLQRQREQLMAPVQQKFADAVKSVGQEGSFTFVFPLDPGLMLYQGTDVVDVTPLVKAKLGL